MDLRELRGFTSEQPMGREVNDAIKIERRLIAGFDLHHRDIGWGEQANSAAPCRVLTRRGVLMGEMKQLSATDVPKGIL